MNSLPKRKKIKICDHKIKNFIYFIIICDHKNFSRYLYYFEFVIALKKAI